MRVLCFIAISLTCFFYDMIFSFRGKTHIKPRSIGSNSARDYAGINRLLDQIQQGDWTGFSTISLAYQRSFAHEDLVRYLLGDKKLFVTGSRVSRRNPCDIMADYFGLPLDYRSVVRLQPLVQHIIIPVYAVFAFDECPLPLYATISLPLVYSSWSMHVEEKVIQKGQLPFPAGYHAAGQILRAHMPDSFAQVLQGNSRFGDLKTPLLFGTVPCKKDHRIGCADIACNIEYAWLVESQYAVSCGTRLVIPTSNRSKARRLFESIVGNEGHWELGITAHGRYDLWYDSLKNRRFSFYADVIITHLCSAYQWRSFDLRDNGPGSRYLLLEKMGPVETAVTTTDTQHPIDIQYQKELVHAINVTTQPVKMGIRAQIDGLFKIVYQHDQWSFDVGYNGWFRSRERAHSPLTCIRASQYAVKGDAQIYGYRTDAPFIGQAVGLNATQSCATIHSGQGAGNTTNNFINSNVDGAALAYVNGGIVQQTTGPITNLITPAHVHASQTARLLTVRDIDVDSGCVPSARSHKICAQVGYTKLCDTRVYLLSIGLEASFASGPIAERGIMSEWAAWCKGAILF